MEGGRQQITLRRVLALEPILRYREKFGDQCRDGFGCDGLELAAKARNLPVNPLQLGTEVFDRKLVERHNRLIAYCWMTTSGKRWRRYESSIIPPA